MSYLRSQPDASLLDLFKAYPEVARPLHELAQAVMRGPSPFGEGQRELIAAYVSSLNGCGFCRASHSAVAERFGEPKERLEALLDDLDTADVPDAMRPVFGFVNKLNEAPAEVGQADVDAVLDAGWDEDAVIHAALVCGFFNLMNRWVDALGLEADETTVEMAARHLHERGYQGILEFLGQRAEG